MSCCYGIKGSTPESIRCVCVCVSVRAYVRVDLFLFLYSCFSDYV